MIAARSILCPIDFSESSRGALRYAAAVASQLGARLTLLAVNDSLLIEAAALAAGPAHLVEDTIREARKFARDTFAANPAAVPDLHLEVAAGKAASEILRVAQTTGVDLVVMGSHGATGFRRLFFGSTTERVLRETTVPVLVTPGSDPGPLKAEDGRRAIGRVLAPVDLTAATQQQLAIARSVAEALSLPVLVLHVVEPVRAMAAAQSRLPKIDAERRHRAERELEAAVAAMPPALHAETLVTYGEPAEEIAKVAANRGAGLIVMGLHSSPVTGPRMGSVTYRVLCLAHRLVLGLPPQPAAPIRLKVADSAVSQPVA